VGEGFEVDTDQLAQLASRFNGFSSEFDAILTASQAISQDDDAYGLLCSWIPAILEGRHEAFDELMRYGQENMMLLAEAVGTTADDYSGADHAAASDLERAAEDLG
jgi:hypothetical protein